MGIQSVSKRWGDYEGEPLIYQSTSPSEIDIPQLPFNQARKRPFYFRWPFFLHVALIILYTFTSVLVIQSNTEYYSRGPRLVYSPAREAVLYESRYFVTNVHKATKYFGEPDEAKEAAWDELLSPTTIRVSAEDMERFGRTDEGIKLPSGEYMGTVNAFHDLHCLRRISRLVYEDHYWPNVTQEIKSKNRIHAQHCLDRLRQSIQCQGDITVATYRWGELQSIPLANFSMQHECINWNALYDWADERKVDVFEPGLLIHPKFGPAYAHLAEDGRTGAVHDIM